MTENFEQLLKQHETKKQKAAPNTVVEGTIIDMTKDFVMVDIGYKSEGMVPIDEFKGEDGAILYKIGDKINVFLYKDEDHRGNLQLSKAEADRLRIWESVNKAYEEGSTITGLVTSKVKGGLQVDIGIKAFLPGSQIDLRPIRHLESLIGNNYEFKVIKVNQKRGNIVLSRRALLEREREEMKATTLRRIEEGQIVDGIIKNLTDYGAFVDLGGIDGLLHITDMSWGRVTHPSEMFHVGDEVRVKVLSFDKDHERVSLGLKQITDDPWSSATAKYIENSRHKGKIVSLADYGAFVELERGVEGLIHISEMSWTKRLKHPSKLVAIGDEVDVVVLGIDVENKRIALGMKQMEPNPWSLLAEKYPIGSTVSGKIKNITDFGIFIGIEDGIDGLIHISDISWTQKSKNPQDTYKKGDEVEAKVLSIDIENERFSLGIKQLTDDPWKVIPERYKDKVVDAKVLKKVEYGFYVELEADVTAFLHRSEISQESSVKEGEVVKVKVLSIDSEERKISVSVNAYEAAKNRTIADNYQSDSSSTVKMSDLMTNED
ncbi:30S ribosomal protein S1 [bacterium]|nr:30S ribosomal protein S1 [bacterium]